MAVLEVSQHAGTAVLTMNRPEKRNALDDRLRSALAVAIDLVRDDSGVRSIVLTGSGGHFCAGADVEGLRQMSGEDDIGLLTRKRMQRMHRWFGVLVDLEKPVVAAVDGVAYGAGLSLALAADFVLASPGARFCAAFGRVGLVPDAGAMYLLPRQVGMARAKELVFSARAVAADEALRIGLAHQVVEGDLLTAALAFAAQFNDAALQTIAFAKASMNRAFESDRQTMFAQEAMAQGLCRSSNVHAKVLQTAGKRS